MKNFDLEKAKAGGKVRTREGRPARIVCFDAAGAYPIVALVRIKDDNGDVYEQANFYYSNGRILEDKEYDMDLVMCEQTVEDILEDLADTCEKFDTENDVYQQYKGDKHRIFSEYKEKILKMVDDNKLTWKPCKEGDFFDGLALAFGTSGWKVTRMADQGHDHYILITDLIKNIPGC